MLHQRNALSRGTAAAVALAGMLSACPVSAQTCTTQGRMQPALRSALADAALTLGSAVKAGDPVAVKAATAPALAANFAGTESLVRSTAEKLQGDTLRVAYVYELDATARKAGDMTSADFSCVLKDSNAETDFSIASLPPGDYGFAMVEAAGGARPWLLSFVLQREGAAWKMAGFYPHARTAAGRDGKWYWTAARERAKAKQPFLAWLYYNQADALLQPAPFVSSTNLDLLRSEERTAAPPEIADGVSAQAPLIFKGANGAEFRITSLSSESTTDDKSLRLVVHVQTAGSDAEAVRRSSEGAARSLVSAHPELRQAYTEVLVFGESAQAAPALITLPMAQIQ